MEFNLDITQASLLTVAGGSAAVGLVLLMLRGVLKDAWTDNINRYAALVLSLAVVEGVTYSTGTTAWFTYFTAFFVACQVTLAVLNGSEIVANGIVRGHQALMRRRAAKAGKEV